MSFRESIILHIKILVKNDICEVQIESFLGMASLFATLSFAIVRFLIVMKKDNIWLETSKLSTLGKCKIQLIWLVALSFSLPPLFGFGRYENEMIGVRYCYLVMLP